jgi:hypothetical protein
MTCAGEPQPRLDEGVKVIPVLYSTRNSMNGRCFNQRIADMATMQGVESALGKDGNNYQLTVQHIGPNWATFITIVTFTSY